jgi:quercetin dioxygenase-like cupin family protein
VTIAFPQPYQVSIVAPQPLSVRDKVNIVEAEMLKHEQIDIPVKHYFSQGVYAREITIPAGAMVTGKIHKFEQLNILSKGEMSVLTDDGVKRVQAPFTIVSPPGTKRIAIAHSECVWTTIHGTDETDVDKIEAHFIAQSDADYAAFLENTKIKEIA